jgi:hypothetical protein
MHVFDGAGLLVQAWQPEVALLEDILLVDLGDGQDIGSLPSVVHNGGGALSVLEHPVGGAAVARDVVGGAEVGAVATGVVGCIQADSLLDTSAILHVRVFSVRGVV